MNAVVKPIIFISYSHKDADWKDRLVTHLGVLKYQGLLDIWDDLHINAGDDWFKEIQDALNSASAAVLLVSANALTSEFILREEILTLLDRRGKEGVRIVPIIIKPCAWEQVEWLTKLQVLPVGGHAMSTGNESQIDADFAVIAKSIYKLLSQASLTPEPGGPKFPAPESVSIGRLPVTGRDLFGRERELEWLNRAWDEGQANIVSITAWGGVGKTALINHWLRRMGRDNYRRADKVFAWSFYRQGTSARVASADEFITSALSWFGDSEPNQGTSWEKGARLARLIREQRTLLLLDGLEPLQYPPGLQEGYLKDVALQALLREVAGFNPGLCIISSRLPLTDLEDYEGDTACRIELENLPPSAGAKILRVQGVKGPDAALQQASEEFDGHCLALTLLGNYLKDAYDGDVGRRAEVTELEQDTRQGSHARRVMASYESWFGEGPELAVLRLIGFFDRPAEEKAVAALRAAPAIPGLTDTLQNLRPNDWRLVVAKLRRAKLLSDIDQTDTGSIDAHPLVREHFGRQVRQDNPEGWKQGCERLYEYFKSKAKALPDTVQEMVPLFQAVAYGCHSGRHRDALYDVYLPRIMRGDKLYAARQLSLRGALLSVLSFFFERGDWDKPVAPRLPAQQGVRPEDELIILAHAGLFWTATKGYAAEEARTCYSRVQMLAESLGKTDLLYTSLISQWRYALVTDELTTTLRLAEEILNLARRKNDPTQLTGAFRALSNSVYFAGDFALAETYAREGISIWNSQQVKTSAEEMTAPVVICMCVEAMSLWHLGFPEQALMHIREANSVARQLEDVNALAVALYIEGFVRNFCGMAEEALAATAEGIEISTLNGFKMWSAGSEVSHGWALATKGRVNEGLALMQQGTRGWRDTGAELLVPYYLSMQVETLGRVGRTDEAILLLKEAQSAADKLGEHWWTAELYRLRGNLLIREDQTSEEGELLLNRALDVALSQGSKSLELRAVLSLCSLWVKQNKKEAARLMLSEIYHSYTEGFETADLKKARTLLIDLS